MKNRTISCMATSLEDEPIPLFVGRQDGTIEKYISITDADLGRPSLLLRGHTKTVTGLAAISADELYSCSMDGTVKRWNAEIEFDGRRTVRSIDAKTPLRCLHMSAESRVYVGGENGGFVVIDGERRSSFTGHKGAVTAITATMDGLVITGGMDNQIRVWDISSGTTIRLLMGHQNPIKCLVLIEDDDDEDGGYLGDSRGLILSFSLDRSMKVWHIPDPQDAQEEVPLALSDERKSTVVSFKEPPKEDRKEEENVPEGGESEKASVTGSEAPPDEKAVKAVEGGEAENTEAASENNEAASENKSSASPGESTRDAIAEVFGSSDFSVGPPIKSAMKTKEKQAIRRDEALGTIELPEAPYCSFREEGAATIYVGTTRGYVYGLESKYITAIVLRFTSRNKGMVKKDIREMKQTVKNSVTIYKKECRKLVKAEEKKHLRTARKTIREKKKKENEEKQKEREAMIAARRSRRHENTDGDEEEEEEEEEEFEEEINEEEEDEEEEDPLHILSEEQREELKKFVEEKEKERDEKIKALEGAFTTHLTKVEPKGEGTYDRKREEFHRLHWTTYTKAGKETLLALTAANGKVYAAQGDRVLPTVVTKGVTVLR